ncbi:MAG: hypothetical protein V6Z86_10035 [Hyphomicrobiales bacterium]
MSAETVLNNVLLQIGLDPPSPQLSGDDYDIRQIGALMNAAGEDIAGRAEWSGLYRDWSVPGGLTQVDLPRDFQKMASRGAARLNGKGFRPIRLVVAPEQWTFLTARPSAQPYCHLAQGKLRFSPPLPVEGATIRYVSTQWVEGKAGITQNGDRLKIPERLVEKATVWRWRRQKGLAYDDMLAEFEADLVADIKADRGEG